MTVQEYVQRRVQGLADEADLVLFTDHKYSNVGCWRFFSRDMRVMTAWVTFEFGLTVDGGGWITFRNDIAEWKARRHVAAIKDLLADLCEFVTAEA